MSPLTASSRVKHWKRWFAIVLLLTAGAFCGMVYQPPAMEFHGDWGCSITRSGPLWATRFCDWTEIQVLQNLFVIETEASLHSPDCNDDDLKNFERFRKFKLLEITGANVTDEGLRTFSNVNHLETLHIMDVAISARGLENLERMPQLRTLRLDGQIYTDAHLRELHDVQTLKAIELINTNSTPEGRDELARYLPTCRITTELVYSRPLPAN